MCGKQEKIFYTCGSQPFQSCGPFKVFTNIPRPLWNCQFIRIKSWSELLGHRTNIHFNTWILDFQKKKWMFNMSLSKFCKIFLERNTNNNSSKLVNTYIFQGIFHCLLWFNLTIIWNIETVVTCIRDKAGFWDKLNNHFIFGIEYFGYYKWLLLMKNRKNRIGGAQFFCYLNWLPNLQFSTAYYLTPLLFSSISVWLQQPEYTDCS